MRKSDAEERDPGPVVRPYTITGGRTRSVAAQELDLELETLISTTSLGEFQISTLSLERRQIALLCRKLLSVAEVSAQLDVTFGVARVLVGDMAGEGLLQVHRSTRGGESPDLALLERVLYGLREI
jgi:hypothetical protein